MDPQQGQESRAAGHKISGSASSADSSVQSIGIAGDMSSDFDRQNTGSIHGNPASSPLPPMPLTGPSYDQSRIPASVFNSKPSTPMDWSVASNESLFSIQIGNSSFSREQFIMMNKSGELPRLDEQQNAPFGLPTVTEAGDCNSHTRSMENVPDVIEAPVGPAKDTGHGKDKVPPVEACSPTNSPAEAPISSSPAEAARISHDSHDSNQSFAFQVVAGNGSKGNSEKADKKADKMADKEKSEPQPQPELKSKSLTEKQSKPDAPKSTRKAAPCSWFSCFSCCSIGS